MNRFVTNVGFALIFIVVGSIAGGIITWLGSMFFSLVYDMSNSRFLDGLDSWFLDRAKLVAFLAVWLASTLWLMHKRHRIDSRWRDGNYLWCLRCGYNLRGNKSNACPECGYEMTPAQKRALGLGED